MNNPHVGEVADLLDPYLTHDVKAGLGGKAAPDGYAIWWLRTHPGRWALVGEGTLGMSREMLERVGLKCANRTTNGVTRIYGQCPHPMAEDLFAALRRTPKPTEPPALTPSDFGWTAEELAWACQVARDERGPEPTRRLHLFATAGIEARRRQR
jgi:hypothetical protein